jgi:hypothetical protein
MTMSTISVAGDAARFHELRVRSHCTSPVAPERDRVIA